MEKKWREMRCLRWPMGWIASSWIWRQVRTGNCGRRLQNRKYCYAIDWNPRQNWRENRIQVMWRHRKGRRSPSEMLWQTRSNVFGQQPEKPPSEISRDFHQCACQISGWSSLSTLCITMDICTRYITHPQIFFIAFLILSSNFRTKNSTKNGRKSSLFFLRKKWLNGSCFVRLKIVGAS